MIIDGKKNKICCIRKVSNIKRCIFILPYFGKLKEYFSLFLRSCSTNKDYDWLIITDDRTMYDYPVNVHVKYMTFEDFKDIVALKLNFAISLDKPYKLCDYKPVYGYVLEDLIKDYEYWGHCDCDLLFGDLNNLLSPLLEKGYDKLFAAGHLTIYRNSYENNRKFMLPYKGKEIFKEALGKNEIYAFDEDYRDKNVNAIFIEQRYKIYTNDLSFNCSNEYYNFIRVIYDSKTRSWITQSYEPAEFYWENGKVKVLTYNKTKRCLENKSYLYIHLQGRDMKVDSSTKNFDCIRIEPARFTGIFEYPKTTNEWKRQQKIYLSCKIIRLFIRRKRVKEYLLKIVRVFKFQNINLKNS